MVKISILEFFNQSTLVNKKFKRLAIKSAKKKKAARIIFINTSAEASAGGVKVYKINNNQFTKFLTFLADEFKLFYISTFIRVSGKKHNFKFIEVQADQGLKINIIFINLVKKYRLEFILLKKKKFVGLTIITVNYKNTKLEYFVNVEVGVKDI